MSKAACGLCAWVRAMEAYATVLQGSRPKQEQAQKAGKTDSEKASELSPPATPGAAAAVSAPQLQFNRHVTSAGHVCELL